MFITRAIFFTLTWVCAHGVMTYSRSVSMRNNTPHSQAHHMRLQHGNYYLGDTRKYCVLGLGVKYPMLKEYQKVLNAQSRFTINATQANCQPNHTSQIHKRMSGKLGSGSRGELRPVKVWIRKVTPSSNSTHRNSYPINIFPRRR